MKNAKFLSMLMFVLVAVLLHPSSAMAAAQKSAFAGTSNFGETLDAGEWTISCQR